MLVANESIEDIRRKKENCVYLKVDYAKAYDSVRWDFIYYMFGRLGLCKKWIGWIKNCLEMSLVSVLVNGSPTIEFIPEKGLRQGDHLTTFIFLIMAEGLAGVVRQAKENDLLDNIEIGERKTNVSMVQFVDDTLFFSKANLQSVLAV